MGSATGSPSRALSLRHQFTCCLQIQVRGVEADAAAANRRIGAPEPQVQVYRLAMLRRRSPVAEHAFAPRLVTATITSGWLPRSSPKETEA
jgi:hypothetical protein